MIENAGKARKFLSCCGEALPRKLYKAQSLYLSGFTGTTNFNQILSYNLNAPFLRLAHPPQNRQIFVHDVQNCFIRKA